MKKKKPLREETRASFWMENFKSSLQFKLGAAKNFLRVKK